MPTREQVEEICCKTLCITAPAVSFYWPVTNFASDHFLMGVSAKTGHDAHKNILFLLLIYFLEIFKKNILAFSN